MSLQSLIKKRVADKGISETAKLLSYSANSPIFKERLKQLTEDPFLGLNHSHYDFKYVPTTFARKLSDVLGIPELFYNTVIDDTLAALALEASQKSHFFLETNFKRKGEPIFMLAALESKRYLSLDKAIYTLSLNEQLEQLSTLIKQHNKETPSLIGWGTIVSYVYYYRDDIVLIFSTSGELIESTSSYATSRARLSLK